MFYCLCGFRCLVCVVFAVSAGLCMCVVLLVWLFLLLGPEGPAKNSGSHIDASHSLQPLVKSERLVRYEVNAVMGMCVHAILCRGFVVDIVCLLEPLRRTSAI